MAEETDPTEAEDVRSGTSYPDPAQVDLGTPDPSTPVHRTRAIKPHRVKQQGENDVHPLFWEQKYTKKRRRRDTFHLQRNKEPRVRTTRTGRCEEQETAGHKASE